MRGRALTFVMSATYTLTGIATVLAGAFMDTAGARWVWGGGAATFVVAAAGGYLLARDEGQLRAASRTANG
jgi:hypothetical protein